MAAHQDTWFWSKIFIRISLPPPPQNGHLKLYNLKTCFVTSMGVRMDKIVYLK